ncbi:MAG: TIGR00730 family Rossman fold protein [Phycisphaerae bacterium]|nr:TIGR00730 family Rossman fold protein [Phycisphaerae bacterium]
MPRLANVTVYCSSSEALHDEHFLIARRFGSLLASSGRGLVFGGGRVGLMGETARAVRAAGGRTLGIITQRLKDAEQLDESNTENIVVLTMRERKALLESRGDAMVVLPGGLGTLEEFFEILVGRLLGEHDKPIVMLNPRDPDGPGNGNAGGFYDPLIEMIDHMIRSRFAREGVRALFDVRATPEAVIARLDELERHPVVRPALETLVPAGAKR